jgi:hypothetical protein
MRTHRNTWLTLIAKLGFTRKKQRVANRDNFKRYLRFEQCEDRRVLAPIIVNDPGDFIDSNPTSQRYGRG